MYWTGILLYAIVIFWLLPGMFVSDTAIVLAVAWGVAEVVWLATGEQLPIALYRVADLISILLITRWAVGKDFIVLAIYPAQWLSYAFIETARAQWWTLYWLAIAQFVAAGPWVAFARNRTREGRRLSFVRGG